MSLIKYRRPNQDLFSRPFTDILDEMFNDVRTTNERFLPSIDIAETEKAFEIKAQLPGITKDDINIDLENGRLTISGERKLENEDNNKKYHRVETQYGSFTRSFQLPDSIDQDSIAANFENGVLNITIEKNEEKAKRKIEIQ